MKRFGQIEIITAVIMILTSLAGPAGAEILWSGDVGPSDPSTWGSTSTEVYIGNTNNGTMDITGGSDVLDDSANIAFESGVTGVVTVDGAGSTWTNIAGVNVGLYGNGTMNITNGGAVSGNSGRIGFFSDSTSEVTVDGAGSTWTSNFFDVGLYGNGTLNITNGGAVIIGGGWVGGQAGGTGVVTVDGAGSTWTSNSRDLNIGNSGNGTLNITNGGAVITNGAVSGNSSFIGNRSGGTGEVTVDGTGSTWTSNSHLCVGKYGNGTMNITNGGAVITNRYSLIGSHSGGAGEVTVDGAGSTWTNNQNLSVGNSGNGTLNITGGGLVSVAGNLTIDHNGGDDSFINMATGGMLAVFGNRDNSALDFMGLVDGAGAIRYWNSSIAGWADITGATLGLDYTLEYLTEGELAGYTMLTVPEPATLILLALGAIGLRRRK